MSDSAPSAVPSCDGDDFSLGSSGVTREFRMHPALLWSVITKQAGSLSKAILEGVMNSVDAGATRCDVQFDRFSFSIADDGRGFRDMREIEEHFESFGFPHLPGDALFGRFRMGRGQMMAFGRNRWRSNAFAMNVDIGAQQLQSQQTGLVYELTAGLDEAAGCRVEVDLYEPILSEEVFKIEAHIKSFVRYMSIPVSLNGVVISTDPATERWDLTTPDAWMRFNGSDVVSIYNIGAFVCDATASQFGVGGVVVSREALDVNFARNALSFRCQRWKRINAHLREAGGVKIALGRRLTFPERSSAIERFCSGELSYEEFEHVLSITYVNGTQTGLSGFFSRLWSCKFLSIVTASHPVAVKVHEVRSATVLSPVTLDLWRCRDIDDLRRTILTASGERYRYRGPSCLEKAIVVEPEAVMSMLRGDHVDIPRGELKPPERAALSIVARGAGVVQSALEDARTRGGERYGLSPWIIDLVRARSPSRAVRSMRRFRVGRSDVAKAWTDGTRTVWFERRQLLAVNAGRSGLTSLALIALHELLHDDADTDTHVHDLEFYQMFHDLSVHTPIIGRAVGAMVARAIEIAQEHRASPMGLYRTEIKRSELSGIVGELDLPDGEEPFTVQQMQGAPFAST